MAKFKNEDGEEFEAFTQEELDAKAKEAADKALEEYKAANPPPEEKKEEKTDTPDPLKAISETVASLQQQIRDRDIADMAKRFAGADPEKQTEFKKAFGRLTGYESTPEGLAEQAVAAARIAGIETNGVDVAGVAGTSGGRDISAKGAPVTEADKALQKAFGVSEEDVKKYGPEATKTN